MQSAEGNLLVAGVGSRCLRSLFLVTMAQDNAAGDWAAVPEREVTRLGQPTWRPMLAYEVEVHRGSTDPATRPFEFLWRMWAEAMGTPRRPVARTSRTRV